MTEAVLIQRAYTDARAEHGREHYWIPAFAGMTTRRCRAVT